ncbi:DNA polymerase III subunit gamma/tau C-terminal domain-containing protein, partial [Thiomicrospira sp.]|uniref:DNA polymerase III subunit gamma/tau C-terminal domain-containing protein n=1 Tax=Thiomicrospira sp. TaxID=935 RepID=UPI002F934CA7
VQAWMDMIQQLGLDGMALELARHCVLVDANQQAWWLSVHPEEAHAKTDLAVTRLEEAAQRQFGEAFKVNFVEFSGEFYTPSLYDKDQQTLSQEQATQSIFADANVQMLQERLGMQVLEKSIQPL